MYISSSSVGKLVPSRLAAAQQQRAARGASGLCGEQLTRQHGGAVYSRAGGPGLSTGKAERKGLPSPTAPPTPTPTHPYPRPPGGPDVRPPYLPSVASLQGVPARRRGWGRDGRRQVLWFEFMNVPSMYMPF